MRAACTTFKSLQIAATMHSWPYILLGTACKLVELAPCCTGNQPECLHTDVQAGAAAAAYLQLLRLLHVALQLTHLLRLHQVRILQEPALNS